MPIRLTLLFLLLGGPVLAGGPVSKNVLGETLAPCGSAPVTGAYRDGSCRTGADDPGVHAVCATMTPEFLNFTRSKGNDLVTPAPQSRFPGIKAGDRWCLCAERFVEAKQAGVAPPVDVTATDAEALKYAPLDTYKTP